MNTNTLTPDLLQRIDAYWRAANYLFVWPDLLAALREWQKPCTSDLDSANLGRVRHRILEQNAERERRELAQIKR
jgi:phosphoketolase